MRRRYIKGYHVLAGLALLALVALGGWWTVYFRHSVELEKQAALQQLVHISVVTSLMMGHMDEPPPLGPLAEEQRLQVVRSSERREGDIFSPLVPHFPEIGVRPEPRLIEDIQARAKRRHLMFVGEGTLLFLLIGICTVMLFHLIRSDRRQIKLMEAFLSTVTHEMKTPLTGIKSMFQTFAMGKVPKGQEPMLFAMGLKETERLEHMVENVLISGRLRTEVYQVRNAPCALRPHLERFMEHRKQYVVGRPEVLRLVWEPSERDLQIMADSDALWVVLDNLVDNALKYGGDPPEVTVRVNRAAHGVAVEDRGKGFDPSLADEIFEPFTRLVDEKSGVHHGTGLGLSISRALVRRMDGGLKAESGGQGSRFTVTLKEVRT
ncbi:MAG: HAMP domain-containing sensor histidine kinase [Nanoarchaeota archaeon]|nr:HAMP domain-containing sensor histidine kinase [Nanoarchaeota archaeon]